MISTATALTSAYASRGSGPSSAQATNVSDRDRDHGRHEPARRPGRPAAGSARGCAAPRATIAHDLREQRVRADALGAHHERPRAVDGAADDRVARLLLDRDRLAGDHRLVDRARAFDDDAVDRDLLARPDAQPIAGLDLGRAGRRRSAPSASTRRAVFGARPSSARIARAGPAARPELEDLAEQHERDDHRRGLEVDADLAAVASRNEAGKTPGASSRDHAVDVGDADAERDQREHVEAAVLTSDAPARARRTASRPRAPPASRGASSIQAGRASWPSSAWAAGQHLAHREHEQRRRSSAAPTRTAASCRAARGSSRPRRDASRGSSAMPQIGQLPGPVLHDLGMHRAGVFRGRARGGGRGGRLRPVAEERSGSRGTARGSRRRRSSRSGPRCTCATRGLGTARSSSRRRDRVAARFVLHALGAGGLGRSAGARGREALRAALTSAFSLGRHRAEAVHGVRHVGQDGLSFLQRGEGQDSARRKRSSHCWRARLLLGGSWAPGPRRCPRRRAELGPAARARTFCIRSTESRQAWRSTARLSITGRRSRRSALFRVLAPGVTARRRRASRLAGRGLGRRLVRRERGRRGGTAEGRWPPASGRHHEKVRFM